LLLDQISILKDYWQK